MSKHNTAYAVVIPAPDFSRVNCGDRTVARVDKVIDCDYIVYTEYVYMSKHSLHSVSEFKWDDANIAHIARHNVSPEEAEDVFFDKNNVIDDDDKHSTFENRFIIIGKTADGRLLYQIFTRRGDRIRVISSRDINKREVKLYEKATSRS